jgi:DHA1 family tetracycline resistance protein-like MFS transporter
MVGIFVKSIALLIVARAIVGVSMGNAAVVSATIVDLSDEHNKTKNFGLYCMASGIGFAMGPFLGGWLATMGLLVPFFVAGVASFLNLILIFFLFKETNIVRKKGSIKWAEGIHNLKKAFKMHDLRILFIVVVFFCFGWSLFYEFLPVLWITDYGFSLRQVGFFFAFGSGIFALSSGFLIRPIVDRYKPHSILFYSLFLMGCFVLFPLSRPSAHWIWVYMAVVNFLAAIAFPTYTTIVSNSVGKDSQGEILGVLESIQATAFGLSPLLAGFLLGIHIYIPMLLGGLCTLLAAMLLMLCKKKIQEEKAV